MTKAIITKHLNAVVLSGRKQYTVFEDWLDICDASLRMLPQHALSIAATGKVAEDPDDIKATWARLNQTYKAADWQHLHAAFHALLELTNENIERWGAADHATPPAFNWDVIGNIYEEFNMASAHAGQFFTPWHLAVTTAYPTVYGETLATIAARPEPLRILDPACGSGVMLLAAAACLPREAIRRGLVEFWGNDIDPICVKMARLNMALYGLNRWGRMWRDAGIVLGTMATERSVGPVADIELPSGQLSLL